MGVLTPLALMTALLVNPPHVGIDCTHDPRILHTPRVSISWVASSDGPITEQNDHTKNYKIPISRWGRSEFHMKDSGLMSFIIRDLKPCCPNQNKKLQTFKDLFLTKQLHEYILVNV
jgi:hypothetical protein